MSATDSNLGGSRRAARELVVRALYSQLSGGNTEPVGESHLDRRADNSWARQILDTLPGRTGELDRQIAPLSSRVISEIDLTELCILRLACYELTYCPDTPWRVVITEAVRMAQLYCAEDSYRFINGLLEQLAKQLRPEEI